jgi:hypothetical protein
MRTCEAATSGFTCIREAGHGDLHQDPGYARKLNCNVWILEPFGEDEAMGKAPMTGYRLLTDDWGRSDAIDHVEKERHDAPAERS